jgi:branched-chain amino acid transport system permease protein
MGSVSGSIVGVVFVTLLSEILRNAERGINLGFLTIPPVYGASQIIMSVIFVVVIIFRPKGLLGGRELDFGRLFPGRNRHTTANSRAVGSDGQPRE